jgi:hypothetical protein
VVCITTTRKKIPAEVQKGTAVNENAKEKVWKTEDSIWND